ncbi:MAG: type III secretion system chaperone [Candidatus Methylacidiphilales bacterium]|nr:type III secretion system chaperone [Candidatus Methylacidiphilales bacterium]
MNQAFEGILARFSAALQLNELQPDDDGFVSLEVDGTHVQMRAEEEALGEYVTIHLDLGSYPAENAAAIYKEIAEANYLWLGTGGGTLSANTEDHLLLLSWREPLAYLDHDRLAIVLEHLMKSAEEQKARFSDILESSEDMTKEGDGNDDETASSSEPDNEPRDGSSDLYRIHA